MSIPTRKHVLEFLLGKTQGQRASGFAVYYAWWWTDNLFLSKEFACTVTGVPDIIIFLSVCSCCVTQLYLCLTVCCWLAQSGTFESFALPIPSGEKTATVVPQSSPEFWLRDRCRLRDLQGTYLTLCSSAHTVSLGLVPSAAKNSL